MIHKNFYMMPNCIFDFSFKPKEIAVYSCMVRHSSENNTCFPSRRLIATECGISTKTVDSAIKTLEAHGLIQKERRQRADGSWTSNIYYVTNLTEYEE